MAPCKGWKNASTLILTSPQPQKFPPEMDSDKDANYGVIMLERSSKSSFFPSAMVFPGGGYDVTDSSPRWLDIFRNADARYLPLLDHLKVDQDDGKRSPMMADGIFGCDGLSPEVVYRICAIRETFEETGILIARTNTSNTMSARYARVHNFASPNEAESWRKRICKDPNEFFELFQSIKCVPDVWGLHEWTNWLTPYTNKYAKRYDTFFYKAALESTPKYAREDNVETTKLMIESPSRYLSMFRAKKCVLGPPQIVELSRLLHFSKHADLIKYFVDRGLKGMDCCLPIMGSTSDGVVISVYPGDYWYPKDIDQCSTLTGIKIPVTYESIVQNSSVQPCNHSARFATPNLTCYSTNTMPYGQVNPIRFSASDDKLNSNL